MDRRHDPLFEQARAVIEPVLAELGFSLAEEHYHQRSFGSSIAVYTRGSGALRLIWDGKEETLEADYDSREWLQKRIERLGVTVRTADEIPSLTEVLQTRFRSHRGMPRQPQNQK
jgi:hypothetical protein